MIYAACFLAGIVAAPLILIAIAAPWAYRHLKDIARW